MITARRGVFRHDLHAGPRTPVWRDCEWGDGIKRFGENRPGTMGANPGAI